MSGQIEVYDSAKFKTLVSRKRKVILFLTLFFFCYYISLPLLATFFPNVMNQNVIGGIPFSWFFALSQFLLTAVICIIYFIKAKSFDRSVEEINNEYLIKGRKI